MSAGAKRHPFSVNEMNFTDAQAQREKHQVERRLDLLLADRADGAGDAQVDKEDSSAPEALEHESAKEAPPATPSEPKPVQSASSKPARGSIC